MGPGGGTRHGDVRRRALALSLTGNIGLVARLGGATVVVCALSLLLPGVSDVPPEPLRTVSVILGLLLATSLFLAPWERWAASGHAVAGLLAILVAGVVVVAVVVAASGGATSRFSWVFAIILLFAGMLLPRRILLVFVLLLLAAYATAAAAAPGGLPVEELIFRIAILGLIAVTSRMTGRRMRLAVQTALEQADALSIVAEAGRSVHQLEPDRVLDDLAGYVQQLGYDIVGIYVQDDGGELRYAATRGLDASPSPQQFSAGRGVVGRVLDSGRTEVETAYQDSPAAIESYVRLGVQTAIGTPIYARGAVAGVLVGGTLTPRAYDGHQIETFELLAGVAGRALTTATAFADQHHALEQLRELDRAKSDFVSTVSHELRTPLTVIQGSADLLAQRWEQLPPGTARQLLDRLRANARSLDEVLGSLLDLAQLERGQLETRFERFDLAAVAGRVRDRLAPLLAEHEVTVTLDAPLHVHGDDRLIERVVENLLSNAARHTPPGTRIEVDATTEAGRTTLRVRDHGPGMQPADVERLGERFFRGGDPLRRPSRGVGLGLALSIEILRLHGAELSVTSDPGSGTSFAFSLRRVAPHEPGRRRT